jgi:hypothetical protein
MADLTAQDDHGRVDLSPEGDPGAAPALRDQGGRHLGARTRRQRGGCVAAPVVTTGGIGVGRAAAGSSCSCCQLMSRSFIAAKPAAGSRDGAPAATGSGPPATGRRVGNPLPSADGSSFHAAKLGAEDPAALGKGRSKSLISLTHACLASAVKLSPFHCAGSRRPLGRKPGHDP